MKNSQGTIFVLNTGVWILKYPFLSKEEVRLYQFLVAGSLPLRGIRPGILAGTKGTGR